MERIKPHITRKDMCTVFLLKRLILFIYFHLVWFGFSLVLWHVNHYRLFKAKSIFIQVNILFQTIQFSVSTVSMSKIVLRINFFIYCGFFCPYLGSFFVVCSHYVSAKFHLWTSSGD